MLNFRFVPAGAVAFALAISLGAPRVTAAGPRWQAEASSPRPYAPSATEAALYAVCGEPDAGLAAAAGALLARRLEGRLPLERSELEAELAARGVPQPFARAWASTAESAEELARSLARWSSPRSSLRRCGVAVGADAKGRPVAVAMAVDAAADLEPLATRARFAEWLRLEARLRRPAVSAAVVLLGPSGAPRRVPSSLADGRVVSSFSLDQAGAWLVQVVADIGDGPLPVLEAHVFVEVEPAASLLDTPAAGEVAGGAALRAPGDDLLAMLNAARASEGMLGLVPDGALARVAGQHAEAMRTAGRVSHDLGEGTPDERVEAAGLGRDRVGENVASAPSAARAHRALWASPSHRENMLLPGYRRVGVAAVPGDDGRLWVVELFSE